MPPNFTQLPQLIQHAVGAVPVVQREVAEKINQAMHIWQQAQEDQANLAEIVRHFTSKEDRLFRCAGPTQESIGAQFAPEPLTSPTILVCADGSQKNPSTNTHEGMSWGLVNTACFKMSLWPDFVEMPSFRVETELYLDDARITPGGLILTEEIVDLYRDLREREILAESACEIDANTLVVAAIDGKLELYGSRDIQRSGEFSESLKRCTRVFHRMKDRQRYYLGYVESQRSDLFARLLELGKTSTARERSVIRKQHPLAGVTDARLFNRFLKPGYRSAVFELRTRAQGAYSDDLAVHFFFLNVGDEDTPHTIRVEIPRWYAEKTEVISRIQTILFSECHRIPGHFYMYGLTRADELARVSLTDQQIIQAALIRAYLDAGLAIPINSAKMETKKLT